LGVFAEFAKAYYREALRDLGRARRSYDEGDYPEAVFWAQQAVEKAAKAMLEARRRVVYNHGPELVLAFTEAFEGDWSPEYDSVVEALEYLSEYYTRARYPTLFRGRVYTPEEVVDAEVARRGIELASRAVEVAGRFLRREGILSNKEGSGAQA
jgi:HEPN domain-containing protein